MDNREWAGFDPCFDPCAMVRLSPESQLVAPGNLGPSVYQRFRRQSVWATWCNGRGPDRGLWPLGGVDAEVVSEDCWAGAVGVTEGV